MLLSEQYWFFWFNFVLKTRSHRLTGDQDQNILRDLGTYRVNRTSIGRCNLEILNVQASRDGGQWTCKLRRPSPSEDSLPPGETTFFRQNKKHFMFYSKPWSVLSDYQIICCLNVKETGGTFDCTVFNNSNQTTFVWRQQKVGMFDSRNIT